MLDAEEGGRGVLCWVFGGVVWTLLVSHRSVVYYGCRGGGDLKLLCRLGSGNT